MRDSLLNPSTGLTTITLLLAVSSLHAATHYVSLGSTNPTPPYANWVTAATNIQDALNVAAANDVVLVTDGVYPGGVSVTNALALLSVNGPEFTIISGQPEDTSAPFGTNRCVNLTDGASLTGFTLTKGFAVSSVCGGVWCASTNAFLTNCIIVRNYGEAFGGTLYNCTLATNDEGGASYSTLYNCTLSGNVGPAIGAAAYCTLYNCMLTGNSSSAAFQSTLYNCTLTQNSGFNGGVNSCTLYNCSLIGNVGSYHGGGAYGCTLYNCTLSGNSASATGGGAYFSTLYNCTLTGNNAAGGGGAFGSTLFNCIVYTNIVSNSQFSAANYDSTSTLNYCCTTPLPINGVGNITSNPLFADSANGNLRLQSNSPCINAGNNAYVTTATDLDGNPRIVSGTVDMGAYEYQGTGYTLTVAIIGSGTVRRDPTLSIYPAGASVTLTATPAGGWVFTGWSGDVTGAANPVSVTMNRNLSLAATFAGSNLPAATHYVSLRSAKPTPPYTNWVTAATHIQDALNAAVENDVVLVTNGVYAGGIRVTNPLTLLSVNGPQVTIINGGVPPYGTNCVSLTDGASLTGFTLTNGASDGSFGAGVSCASTNAFLTNCIIVGNVDMAGCVALRGTLYNCTLAHNLGCGAYGSTLYNCTLSGNEAGFVSSGVGAVGGAANSTLYNCTLIQNSGTFGGGAGGGSTLYNCTLIGNMAQNGGGAFGCTLYNCIAYANTVGGNYDSTSTLNYCCTTPLPTNGVGNIISNPLFVDSANGNLRLQSNSPCINAGNNAYVTTATDLDGDPRIVGGTVDMGAYEFLGPLLLPQVSTFPATGISATSATLNGMVNPNGSPTTAWFQWGGTTNYGNLTSMTSLGSGIFAFPLSAPLAGLNLGVTYHFRITATNDYGIAYGGDQSFYTAVATHYVSLGSTNPTPPYASWATAATNIQDAVDAATVAGALVMVSDGVYPGGVAVTNALTLLSVNGPQFTIINGHPEDTFPPNRMNCVSLTDGASLTGFALTNGGGGVLCASTNAFLTNCIIVDNIGSTSGGASGGTLYNCTLTGNWFLGGGASGSTLYNCTLTQNGRGANGGGAGLCTLYNCTLVGNVAYKGGGAYLCTLNNCTLIGNSASATGGGAYWCTLYNCTLTGNGAIGAFGSTLSNCIVYSNTPEGNYDPSSALNYCCTTPLPTNGVGNIISNPLFVDSANGNLRLQSNSPCINAGNNACVTTATDLDGRPRIVGGTVDMGAYEFQPGVSGVFIGWLQQYGLPTDGLADYADPDHDGLNNWQEWVCGTNPTNALSALRMVSALPTSTNVTVSWQSVAAVNYFLERSGDLESPFTLLVTNILGQAGTTSYADTNATGAGPFFYRVGAKP